MKKHMFLIKTSKVYQSLQTRKSALRRALFCISPQDNHDWTLIFDRLQAVKVEQYEMRNVDHKEMDSFFQKLVGAKC